MSSTGSLILGFVILIICVAGSLMIFAQQLNTPMSNLTLGNTSEYTCSTSMINHTTVLVNQTTSFGMVAIGAVLFIVAAFVIISALMMFGGKK